MLVNLDTTLTSTIAPNVAAMITSGCYSMPFDVLGMHWVTVDERPAVAIRTFQPQAAAVSVNREGRECAMEHIHPDGLFEAIFPGEAQFFPYTLSITLHSGPGSPRPQRYETEDPYRYSPVLTDFDLHLFNEGTHLRLYEKLGAQLMEHEGTQGVCFAVWAPNAERASVIGDFNQWDGRRHPMRPRGASGVWELFVPGLQQGELYRFEIKTRYQGYMAVKSDPFAFAAELRPNNASVIWDLGRYQWRDGH